MATATVNSMDTQAANHAAQAVSGTGDGSIGGAVSTSVHYAAGQFTAASTLVGYFVGALPSIATFLTALWCLVMLLESETSKHLFRRFHDWRQERRMLKIEKEELDD